MITDIEKYNLLIKRISDLNNYKAQLESYLLDPLDKTEAGQEKNDGYAEILQALPIKIEALESELAKLNV